MREERLLERIRSFEKNPIQRKIDDPKRVIRSIVNHLQKILNIRTGSVMIADDFGLPDFTDLLITYPESQKDIERSIENMIRRYEPRLIDVKVKFIPSEKQTFVLRFKIISRLVTLNHKMLTMESYIESDRRVRVKKYV